MLSAIGDSLSDLIAGVLKFYTFDGSQNPEVLIAGPHSGLLAIIKIEMDLPGPITSTDAFQLITSCLIGILFGSIHCFGWNFEFPSYGERILWKVCSLAISGIPLIWLLLISAYYLIIKIELSPGPNRDLQNIITVLLPYPLMLIGWVGVPVYILARLGLLTEAFIALRAIPEGAYKDVRWTLLLPHMQI